MFAHMGRTGSAIQFLQIDETWQISSNEGMDFRTVGWEPDRQAGLVP
jgi:hypothetical protein